MSSINVSINTVLNHLGIEYIKKDSEGDFYMVTDEGEKISCDEFFRVVCMHLLDDKDEMYVDRD